MLYTLLLLSLCCGLGHGIYNSQYPVIGVFMQTSYKWLQPYGDMYLPSRYVKFLEQAGAMVVPIKLGELDIYYQKLFNEINGIVYPGDQYFQQKNDYTFAGKIMWDMAIKANDNGRYFPMFAISEGNQMFNYLSPQHRQIKWIHDAYQVSLPLAFEQDFRQSRLLKDMPQALVDVLQNTPITPHRHRYSILGYPNGTDESKTFFKVVSYSQTKSGAGEDFVSAMEAAKYPFYGLHWNVERLNFAFERTSFDVHTSDGAHVSQYFANFFVNEARKDNHHFKSTTELSDSLAENYHFMFQVGKFNQIYLANYTKYYVVG